MKTCSSCKQILDFTEFNKKGSGLQTFCKSCNRAASRKYYAKNRKQHSKATQARTRKQRKILREYVISLKETTPCKDCDVYYPWYVMDFDHLRDKKKDISRLVNLGVSLLTLKNEIDKCEIVCSNCHRIRTFTRSKLK